jgi:hypothetical protein
MGIHGSGSLIAIIREASRRHKKHHRNLGKAALSTRRSAPPANDNIAPVQAFQLIQLTFMACVFVVLAILVCVLAIAL